MEVLNFLKTYFDILIVSKRLQFKEYALLIYRLSEQLNRNFHEDF